MVVCQTFTTKGHRYSIHITDRSPKPLAWWVVLQFHFCCHLNDPLFFKYIILHGSYLKSLKTLFSIACSTRKHQMIHYSSVLNLVDYVNNATKTYTYHNHFILIFLLTVFTFSCFNRLSPKIKRKTEICTSAQCIKQDKEDPLMFGPST